MNRNFGFLALTGILTLAACGQNTTPTCANGQTLVNGVCTTPGATTGVLNIQNPNGYAVTVTNAAGTTVPSSGFGALTPGSYTVTFSRDGYVSQTTGFSITAGNTTTVVAPTLVAAATNVGAYYINANGNRVDITAADTANAGSKFVFYSWLEDETGGVTPANLATGAAATTGEQAEVAPLNTQNIAASYVGYRAADGNVYPVVGANVRWDITEQTGSVRFSAADDGTQASGAPISGQDINDNGLNANTYTNAAAGTNVRFPSSATYPTYNLTGINTPDTNGFSWTALNHDPRSTTATARVRVIASVNGTEIDKQWLDKTFAPSAELTITKTPADNAAGLNQARDITVTVTNTGEGPATGIQLNDVLRSGDGNTYSIAAPTGTTANTTDGFDTSFDLAPGASRSFVLSAQASAVGVYCDVASIVSYTNGQFGVVTPSDLNAQACLTVTAPNLNIVKTLGTLSADGATFTPIASGVNVAPNTPVYARVTVSNGGSATATNVVVTEGITAATNAANYQISGDVVASPANTVTMNGNDGFTSAAFSLAAGATQTFTFPATGSVDGTYCDTASATATSNNGGAATVAGNPTAEVCFTVSSPNLSITKVNQSTKGGVVPDLYPGSSYRSVITVRNNGTGAANNVAVSDLLGSLNGRYVNFGSGTYSVTNADGSTASSGSLATSSTANTVVTSPATVTLGSGQSITLTLTSSIPAGTPAGQYCDVASYTSTNGNTGSANACVTVVNFVSTATQMADGTPNMPADADPITADGVDTISLTSAIIVEPQSNEGVNNNVIVYNFGSTDPRGATAGVFQTTSTQVYYDPNPQRDSIDGKILSDYTNGTRLTEGTEYTLNPTGGNTTTGTQTLSLTPNFTIVPGGVVWVRHVMVAPVGTPANRTYNSSLLWRGNGANDGTATGGASSEPTSVILPQ
ncbi:beta strand repeat-containing protein [Deinococcus petrolearius]|uniref:Beta strand repeat-containing protein n=1 Tax=Deinococcus petrolearius TaxID=1751295 RepID=A0ABW1DG62_9DEIO